MHRSVPLDDPENAEAIDREIRHLRESNALGRSSKLRDLFDYLVERSRSGTPPREVEIAQDVFHRTGEANDDGAGRVYIHRLRKRLEEIYKERGGAELRIAFPLGEYRLVAEIGAADAPVVEAPPTLVRRVQWRPIATGAAAGLVVALLAAFAILVWWPGASWPEGAEARRSPVWAPIFANSKSVIVAEGDHYLFAEKGADGATARLVRDPLIRSREELDTWLLRHPDQADRYADAGAGYVPVTVPRAQLYLSRILLASPNVRMLPASQVPAAAMLSQNIVYLGLVSGLGPLRAPVTAGSRFDLGVEFDDIRDTRTGKHHSGVTPGSGARRQYGLVSVFSGKEGNRYLVLAGTSEMGLVGLAETLADPKRLRELSESMRGAAAAEALYEIDSQGAGILSVRLIAANVRDPQRVWQP